MKHNRIHLGDKEEQATVLVRELVEKAVAKNWTKVLVVAKDFEGVKWFNRQVLDYVQSLGDRVSMREFLFDRVRFSNDSVIKVVRPTTPICGETITDLIFFHCDADDESVSHQEFMQTVLPVLGVCGGVHVDWYCSECKEDDDFYHIFGGKKKLSKRNSEMA